jgi:serine/threonine-protein kinase
MSPEQARGDRDIGAQSDVYSLGVIVYELLSGQRPHEGDSFLQILHRILTRPPTPLDQVCPGLPGPVYDVVRRAMATEPSERVRGVSELAEALEPFRGAASRPTPQPSNATRSETMGARVPSAAAESVAGVARPASPPRRARNVALGATAAMAAIAAIAAGAWTTHGTKQGSVVAPSDAGLSAPDLSGERIASGSPGPDAMAPDGAGGGSPPAPGAMDVTDAGQAAQVRRKPSPVKEPCKLTHYVDREGNMHFSTDCPPNK